MKNAIFLGLITFAMLGFSIGISAQDTKPDPQETPQPAAQQDTRAGLMQQIGLAPDQIRQIRRLNMERKPLMEEAQKRLREANRLLDEAIYADDVNEADVQAKLKDAQTAQAEVFRIRSMNELSIRRILTPEQLGHFRELRQRFEQARQDGVVQRNPEKVIRNIGKDRPVRTDGVKQMRPLVRQTQAPVQTKPQKQ